MPTDPGVSIGAYLRVILSASALVRNSVEIYADPWSTAKWSGGPTYIYIQKDMMAFQMPEADCDFKKAAEAKFVDASTI